MTERTSPTVQLSMVGLILVTAGAGLVGGLVAGGLIESRRVPTPKPPAVKPPPPTERLPPLEPDVPQAPEAPDPPKAPDPPIEQDPPSALDASPLEDGPPFSQLDVPLDSQSEFVAKTRQDAARGQVDAMRRLAEYMAEEGYDVHLDQRSANDWLRRARAIHTGDADYTWSVLTLQHADLLARPLDPRMANVTAALELYTDVMTRSANVTSRINARVTLARHYAQGLGVPADLERSYRMTVQAAEAGLSFGKHDRAAARASLELGRKLERGEGCPASPAGAAVWYRRAIDFDSNPSDSDYEPLLRLLEAHPEVDIEPVWFETHATNTQMMFVLGRAHEQGTHGLEEDDAQALRWFRAAHAEGHVFAAERITAIQRRRPELVQPEGE